MMDLKLGHYRVRYDVLSLGEAWQVRRRIKYGNEWDDQITIVDSLADRRRAKRLMHRDLRSLRAEKVYYDAPT